jgi:hypothetical protein
MCLKPTQISKQALAHMVPAQANSNELNCLDKGVETLTLVSCKVQACACLSARDILGFYTAPNRTGIDYCSANRKVGVQFEQALR